MTNKDIKTNWYYYCSLATQLQRTTQFVDHAIDDLNTIINGKTFSNEFAKILMLASSEFEVVAKSICRESGIILSWNANIISITREITDALPHIGETIISTPYQMLQPLKNWEVAKVSKRTGTIKEVVNGIDWWGAYNKIKHNRSESFPEANLENSIYAMASLAVMELYLSQIVLGNVDDISSIPCEYFSFEYGLANLLGDVGYKLPDFAHDI